MLFVYMVIIRSSIPSGWNAEVYPSPRTLLELFDAGETNDHSKPKTDDWKAELAIRSLILAAVPKLPLSESELRSLACLPHQFSTNFLSERRVYKYTGY